MQPLHKHESILSTLDTALREKLNFVGDTDVPKLVFLSLYTRFLKRPMGLILKAPPANSKSISKDCGLAFIPKDAYVSVTGLSPKWLVHLEPDALKNKFLVVGEFAGINKKDGLDQLRQFQSEDDLAYGYSTPGGNVTATLEGPMGLLMTTTKTDLHVEDESRSLSVHMKNSEETIRKILEQQAQGLDAKKTLADEDVQQWFALNEYVQQNIRPVEIPYDPKKLAALLPKQDRATRDLPKVRSLIVAHALLHQDSREKTRQGAVVATEADYTTVAKLVEPALARGLLEELPELTRPIVNAVEAIHTKGNGQASKKKQPGVTAKQVAAHLKLAPAVISRAIKLPLAAGYLTNRARKGSGVSMQLVPGDVKLPSGTVLPKWQEIVA